MGGLLALMIPRISEIIGEILAQPLKPGGVDRSARRTKREALQNPQRKSENLLNPRPNRSSSATNYPKQIPVRSGSPVIEVVASGPACGLACSNSMNEVLEWN